jgi:hypothetical protein
LADKCNSFAKLDTAVSRDPEGAILNRCLISVPPFLINFFSIEFDAGIRRDCAKPVRL